MENNTPKLSVIVPIYGVEKYLSQCIESIIAQEYKNLEIILVDDGAKGREPEICDSYAKKDSRIKVIHKQNGGLVAARKTGLKTATADYVAFVDGDDFIAPDYYENMMRHIIDEHPDMLVVNFTQYKDESQEIIRQQIEDGIYEGEKLQYLLRNMNCKAEKYYTFGIWPSTCLKIYKTDLLRKLSADIPENVRMGEDSSFTFPYLLNCNKVVVDNSICGYFYRIVHGSMSRTTDESLFYASSALYEYLKPIYAQKGDIAIQRQLECFRLNLMDTALTYWQSDVKFMGITKRTKEIKHLVEATTLFDNVGIFLTYDTPPD